MTDIPAKWPDLRDDPHLIAEQLVKQHGDEAPIHAAMHADAMLEKGDLNGRAVWLAKLSPANHS